MAEKIDKPDSSAPTGLVWRIAATFSPYRPTVVAVGLLILVTAGLGVVNPVLIRVVFDTALFPSAGAPDLELLWILAGTMAGITVVTGGLGIVQTFLTNRVGQRVMRDLRDRLLRAPPEPVHQVVHGHAHRRDSVPRGQRRRRSPERRHEHCVQRAFEHRHFHQHADRHA